MNSGWIGVDLDGALAAWERRVRRLRDDVRPYAGKSPRGQIKEAAERGQSAAREIVPRDFREQMEVEEDGEAAKGEFLANREGFAQSEVEFDRARACGAETYEVLGGLRSVFRKGPGWPGRRSTR